MMPDFSLTRLSRSRLPILGLLAAAVLLLGSSCGDDGPTGGGDSTPPTVILTSPADGATDVPVGTNIMVTFSEKIDQTTAVPSSVTITPSVSVTRAIDDSAVTLIPNSDLAYNTTFTVTVSTVIKDRAGNAMAQAFDFSFTTEIDPNTLPASLLATSPLDNAVDVAVNQPVSATFSKGMDSASTAGAFMLDNGATGTVTVNGGQVVFAPDADLAYSTMYTATITAAAQDTFGINIAALASWSFTTEADPATPTVTILAPEFDAIVGDTFAITAEATSSVGIDSVEYRINGFPIGSATTAPYELVYSLPAANIGDGFQLTARAYAENLGQTLVGFSSVVDLWYQWVLLAEDNAAPPEFLKTVWARSSDSVLEFRFEYWADWNAFPYPRDTIVQDTMGNVDTLRIGDDTFAFALYLDTDRSNATGRSYLGNPPDTVNLNNIGADFRILVGLFGGDTCLSEYSDGTQSFNLVFDTTGLASHLVPPDTNVFVIGIRWADLNNSTGLEMIAVNADFSAGASVDPTFDYLPDLGGLALAVIRQNRYIGPLESGLPAFRLRPTRTGQKAMPVSLVPPNPFD